MKNQYFGDINDYRKYGLLLILSENGRGLAICWMRTPDDMGPDGRRRRYHLEDEAVRWEKYDPPLYRALQRIDSSRPHMSRSNDEHILSRVRDEGILPEAKDFPDLIPEGVGDRRDYLTRFLTHAGDAELVFFDPDNGLEVPSAPYRVKRSPKHLYTDELWRTFDAGHSALLCQHFGRKKRDQFILQAAEDSHLATGVPEVMSFRTAHVVFFLVPQRDDKQMLARVRHAETAWLGEIQSQWHSFHSCTGGLDHEKNPTIPRQAQSARGR